MKQILMSMTASLALATTATADPAMWKISDDDNTIWLFGSVHVLKPETEWRTDALDAAIAEAEAVYFEAPTDENAQGQFQQLIFQYGLNPEGTTLTSLLDEEQIALLNRVAAAYGVPVSTLEPLRPWLAGLMIPLTAIQASGYDPNSGVEMVLSGETDDSLERFFETPEEQIRFFADLPDDIGVQSLVAGLQQLEDDPAMLDHMVAAWAAGDVEQLDEIFHGAMRDLDAQIYQTLIVDRNVAWVEELDTLMDGSDDAVIVVGAGHLVGESGVPTLLEAEGYTVERVQ